MKPIAAIILFFALSLITSAQPKRSLPSSQIMLEVDGQTAIASTVESQSQFSASGELTHNVTATLNLAQSADMMKFFSTGLHAPVASLNLNVLYLSHDFKVNEVREYKGVTITDIDLGSFDAASKSTMTVVVRMTATILQTKPGGDRSAKGKLSSKVKQFLRSSFKVKVGELPSTRISKIDMGLIVPCAQRTCDSVTSMTVTVSSVDAAAWRAWFENATSNPNLNPKEGEITLLSQNLKDPLGAIILKDVRPLSYADVVGSGSGESVSTARIGLRVASVEIKIP